MRDLDSRAQALMKNIDLLSDEYLRTQKNLTDDQKKEHRDKIQGLFNKAKVMRSFKQSKSIKSLLYRNTEMTKYN